MDVYDITASALTAQRLRLDTITSNLANVNSTRKPDGTVGAYRRKNVVFAPILDESMQQVGMGGISGSGGQSSRFAQSIAMRPSQSGLSIGPDGRPLLKLSAQADNRMAGTGVQVAQITEDTETPLKRVYDPSHPDADKEGYVELPNVNVVTEMVDMISATRTYEANVTAMQSAKAMNQSALEM